MANRISGAVFAGPPNFNPLYRRFTDDRDPGTREVAPVYRNGRIVRFDSELDAEPPPEGQEWATSRVLYLVHPSDPIVWWSPDLILNKPDWLREPRGDDVLSQTRWIPLVTFWQVASDLTVSTGVPSGHGHRYSSEYVAAWNDVLRTELSQRDVERIGNIVTRRNTAYATY